MNSLVRGPFNIKWGDNIINGVEEVSIEHEIDSEDFSTVQGQTVELDGAYKVTASLTLLASDIPALSALFPQYFVPNGGVMSTGETVNNADGAIDIKAASCDENLVFNHLDFESCANPALVLRIVNARSKVGGIELDNKLMKVMVEFVGEPDVNEATLQFFKKGTINVVS